uniref:BTB domain-containing protein n=1 Tax=Panagrellus redivivus TaxID=6233 RepID=A0A7E4UNH1_PANRE
MALPQRRRPPCLGHGIFDRFIHLGRSDMSSSPPHPDFVSLNINRYDDGSVKASEPREVPGFDGLFWTLRVYPNGRDEKQLKKFCDVFLHISGGPIRVKATVILDETKKTLDAIFQAEDELGFPDFCLTSHLRLLPGENQFNCIVAFESVSDPALWVPRPYEFVDEAKDNTWDTEFIVGDSRIKVHRGFLSMTSSVFDAEFNNTNGKENTNTVSITDFPFEAVKNSVDYIYGHDLGAKTPAEIVDVLRFVRKYSIDTAIAKLEAWLLLNITPETFPVIAKYAWEYENAEMQAECSRFYAQNVEQLKDLTELESSIITGIESFKL